MNKLPNCCLVDANVLFSVVKREIIVSMALDGLLNIRWSEKILDEMREALHKLFVKKYANVLEATRNSLRVYNSIRVSFPSFLVSEDFSSQVSQQILPNPVDVHVLQAAIYCNADVIVTDNVRHFPD